ncbi:TetR family transcriptional regulator [Rhodococcus ruber Chol-4]|uniref:Transcriptional regulator n=1 Tax=Rhodococcus ruber TaxID=1830 RepID=A0A098BT62_9NOCA|nr:MULTISPECIES: TetR/AcrR family transcriptional regulator [Rhodococcus]MDO2378133.1 TetR/AcrR family transcriptional regulator [Rhodococcus ruber]ATQ29676.1 TetR/AcrR family transcriptional regulator [Rhodococcus ruber]AUM18694.1 TetR/AcrR family transcriptional regulator [Rhodococcus ruber]AWH01090.1 TetR/AcrR family transcriptional regulator [Rhodococcus ruber]AXY54407.1 TetR family transcriptional regulator [Rhodococcus ruber]
MSTSRDAVISGSKAAARLREAAVEVFAENGYGGTTTRQIAARLDMSPAAMYPHYKSKEELLYAISYEGHDLALEVVRTADLPDEDATTRLSTVIARFAEWQAEHHRRARVVQYELTALTPEHYRVITGLRRRTTQVVRTIVDAGVASGEFTVPDTEGVTLALMSLCVDICRWYPSGRYNEPHAIANLYSDLALRLVGAVR